jgi:hypothetical protein
MVEANAARAIAEQFILQVRGMQLPANLVVFMSAEKRRKRILAEVRKPGDEAIAAQLIAELRDCWSVSFDTVLSDGTVSSRIRSSMSMRKPERLH